MIDNEILEEYGTTDDRLREFFTAVEPTPKQLAGMTPAELRARRRDVKMRQRFQDWLNGLLQEHIVFSLANHSKYQAVDMAWDSMPINRAVVPLMQYAQGRIDADSLNKSIGGLNGSESYVKRDTEGKITEVNLPKFFEVNVNLLRSVISRRVAAQSNKYNRLWPYFKYEPRDQTQVGKLRADMVSQRMDIMADQYDYRRFNDQACRGMLLYQKMAAFPRCHWERDLQMEKVPGSIKFDDKGKLRKRSRIVREGVSWVLPHPSRVFYDNNYPITSLNTDTGCEYVGFWDVTRWGDIINNPDYFNRRQVSFSSGMVNWFSTYAAYFSQYFTTINPPSLPAAGNSTEQNDAKTQVGLFAGQVEQTSCIFTHIWVKVRPKNWGWGRYPYPVWVHLKIAGDATVIYAKICPSSPAAIFSFNGNDSRLINISMAHELLPLQDQLTNLFTQLLETTIQDLFSVCVLNTDVFPDDDNGRRAKREFEDLMQGKARNTTMQMLEVSFQKLAQLGIRPDQVFTVVRAQPNTNIEQIFKAIAQVLNMADRLFVMSPHEQGQAASHEISATESQQISVSTDTVYDYISSAIDEGRAAMKRICYESTIACGDGAVELTVASRYPDHIVKQAGLTSDDSALLGAANYTRLIGTKDCLVHDYIFTSRDGGDRPAGNQAATILVQMLQAIGSLESHIQEAIIGAMGKSKVFEIINQIFRSIDAGVDMKLELAPGEDDKLLASQEEQVTQGLQRMAQQIQKTDGDVVEIQAAIHALLEVIGQMNPQAAQMLSQEMQKIQSQQQPQQQPPPQQPQQQM